MRKKVTITVSGIINCLYLESLTKLCTQVAQKNSTTPVYSTELAQVWTFTVQSFTAKILASGLRLTLQPWTQRNLIQT